MNKVSFYDTILSDIWSVELTFLAVYLTLFTVIYSFILNKRDELIIISQQLKNGETNPLLKQRETFHRKYILRLKKVNRHLINLIIGSFLLVIVSWIADRII